MVNTLYKQEHQPLQEPNDYAVSSRKSDGTAVDSCFRINLTMSTSRNLSLGESGAGQQSRLLRSTPCCIPESRGDKQQDCVDIGRG